jgi:hypothetical protein
VIVVIENNSLARNIDYNGQSPLRTGLSDEIGGQELGDRLGQVDTVDEDVD